MTLSEVLAVAAPTTIFAAGAAWGAVKHALNGTRQDVRDIKASVQKLDDRLRSVEVDVSYLKGQSDVR
jgi:hypothetical protein